MDIISNVGALPVAYYRRIGGTPEIMRSAGEGVIHRVEGVCVAYDFFLEPRSTPGAPQVTTVSGDRWRTESSIEVSTSIEGIARVYFPPEEWLNSIAVFDLSGHLRYARFDAATPPFWQQDVCYQTDLFVDLLYDYGTKNYVILDQAELARAVTQRLIPQRWAIVAVDAITRLAGLGDRDLLPDALRTWCAAPVVRAGGVRVRESVAEVEWPGEPV